jgi:cellulose biosynthesis protein BcsQ
MKSSCVVGILSEKGGVGKTTLTLLIALFLRYLGRKVLVVDMDPSAWSSLLLAYKEFLGGTFYEEVNPESKRESVLGLVEAYVNDEDILELFAKSIRSSSLFEENDPYPIRYIPPSKGLGKFLSDDNNLNDAFRLVLQDVVKSLPNLLRDTFIIVDTAPNDKLMQWSAYNIAGFHGGAFVPIGNSLMDIQGSAITVDGLKRVGAPILALAPIGDRGLKTAQRELEALSSLYRVLPVIPDMDSLANNKWVTSLRLPLRTIPALTAICEILEVPCRTPELHRQVEEARERGYLDVRIPLPLMEKA